MQEKTPDINCDPPDTRARRAIETMRDELVTLIRLRRVLADGETAAKSGLAPLQSLDAKIARVLGIAGAEGAGKSTLINAILGEDLVPVDENQPGTVAPIFIESAEAGKARYSVDAPDLIICESKAVFEKYLLQRENPDNVKGVLSATIATGSSQLAEGLRIVDLPGLEGVSLAIRQKAEAALANVHGAIVVILDRAVGPALKVIERLAHAGTKLEAVIVNLLSSKLMQEGTREALADAEVARHIEALKHLVISAIPNTDSKFVTHATSVPIAPENRRPRPDVFAFHVPSVTGLLLRPDSPFNMPAHTTEIERFAAWFDEAYGRGGTMTRLRDVIPIAQAAADQIGAAVKADCDIIDGLRRRKRRVRVEVKERIAVRMADLPALWAAELERAGVAEAERRVWQPVRNELERLKQRLRKAYQEAEACIPSSWFDQNAAVKRRIADVLNQRAQSAWRDLYDCAMSAQSMYGAECHAVACTIALMERKLVPVELGEIEKATLPRAVWRTPVFDASADGFLEYLDSTNTINRLRREIKAAEMVIDPLNDGMMHKEFQKHLADLRDAQLAVLTRRLHRLIEVADGTSRALLDEAKGRIDEQINTLNRVREAQSIARQALQLDREPERSQGVGQVIAEWFGNLGARFAKLIETPGPAPDRR